MSKLMHLWFLCKDRNLVVIEIYKERCSGVLVQEKQTYMGGKNPPGFDGRSTIQRFWNTIVVPKH